MKKLLLALICVALLFSVSCSETKISGTELIIKFLDAGKADAAIITGGGQVTVIDTGESGFGKTIADELESMGIQKIDRLIITHFDKDHVGGAAELIGRTEIGAVYQTDYIKESKAYTNYIEALEEKGIVPVTVTNTTRETLGGFELIIYPPLAGRYKDDNSNKSSLCITVKNGKNRIMFCADCVGERLSEVVASIKHEKYDIIKMPYHGNWQDGLSEFCKAFPASYAVITSSNEEPEDEKTVDLLSESFDIFMTRYGDVTFRCDGNTVAAVFEGKSK